MLRPTRWGSGDGDLGLRGKVRFAAFLLVASLAHPHAARASLAPPPRQGAADIALDARYGAGDADAPVVLVLYACGRSKACADLVPLLHSEVTGGRLKGKVRMYVRPYFPAAEEDAVLCGRALVAAAEQGMFWPYLLYLYEHRDDFQRCLLARWASLRGLDRDAFDLGVSSAKTTETLAGIRTEALRNGVDRVPCAFINGQKVTETPSVALLTDLLEREFRRVSR